MDLRQLQTFVEVVDRGSFSAAADALGVTQPAVSQQIQTLERTMGAALIDRSGRRATPTERGEVLHRHALRMLAVRDDLARDLAQASDQPSGHLVVGASTGPGEHVLPQLLGSFRAAHPGVEVTLRVDATGAVPAGHRFAGRVVSVAEVVAEPQIVMQSGAGVRTVIEDELRQAGVRLRDLKVAMELGLQESAKSAVEAGYGVCFLSSTALEKELRLGTLATAEVAGLDPVRDFFSVRLATRSHRRLTDAFLAWCSERLSDDFGSKLG
jgi:DNA-binding transcriptional LysR family regulator